MLKTVIKRSGEYVDFNEDNIALAVTKAMKSLGEEYIDEDLALKIAKRVSRKLKKETEPDYIPHVDEIHVMVENTIMDMKLHDLAREYITYRDHNKPNIFKPRTEYKPFEYPALNEYTDAIQQSYWIHTEFNFNGDIQDFKIELTEPERETIRRCMLAISQIEIGVKTFWGKIGDRMPKPEIQEVGATFAESEVRHSRAYSKLLEILGLNDDFKYVTEIPAIKKRIAYMQRAMAGKTGSNREYVESVLLFSLFIENVSLFSQFLIISTFNEHKAVLKGISNAIAATALEENLHAMFGAEIINAIREENPEWFDDEMHELVNDLVKESFEAEQEIIEWIFEYGDFDFLRKEDVLEYIKNRYNKGLVNAGFDEYFTIDTHKLERMEWFDLQINATMHSDFFAKRVVNYSKMTQSFDEDSLFD